MRGGESRSGKKIRRPQGCEGSSPSARTNTTVCLFSAALAAFASSLQTKAKFNRTLLRFLHTPIFSRDVIARISVFKPSLFIES